MRVFVVALAVLWGVGAALPASGQEAEALTLNETLQWDGPESEGRIFAFGDTTVALTLNWAEGGEWVETVTYQISRPELPPMAFDIPAGLAGYGQVGFYAMGDAAGPVLIVGAYTGGAHCCEQLYMVDLGAPDAAPIDAGAYDGGTVIPVDADGDGRFELVVPDPRFHYTFDCYACGAPPAMVLTLEGGELTDISAQPEFQPLFVDDFNRYAGYCLVDGQWQAGVCAGLLGAAARLGLYDGVRAMLEPFIEAPESMISGWETFSFCANEDCTEQTEFSGFFEAMDYALKQWGYLPTD